MINLPTSVQNLLNEGRISIRGLIRFDFGTGTYGFIKSVQPMEYNGLLYKPGGIIQVSDLSNATGLSAQQFTITLAASPDYDLTPETLRTIENEDYRDRPVTIYDAYFHPDTNERLFVQPMKRGYVDVIDHVDEIETGYSIIATMDYDQDRNNSFPDFFFEFRGAPLYDWRKDSSVGGSGDHRWNDKTTHEFSENPIVMEYNYRRGFSINDDLFCGMDMPTSDLPLDKYTLAANICDELAEGETRYRCSIFLDCMITHGDNLASIALSCGALQIDGVDGSWPVVGSDLPTVATFTDDDIVSGSNFKFRAKRSMSDLVNSISGNFPDPDQNWSMIGYDTQIASDLVTLDRRTRDINIDFPQVRSQRQACQLAWIYLYENRFEATSSLTLRPAFQRLEAGDWVLWNSARYGALVFIVTNIQLLSLDNEDGPRNVVLELQQRDGSIYDEVEPPPIVVPYPPGEPVYASELDSFTATAVSVVGFEGRAQAAIRVSWAAVLDATITGVEIQYYPVATPEAVIKKVVDPSVTVHTLAEGIISNTLYKVQAKIITTPLRVTNYNAGIELITLNITIGIGQIDGAIFTTLGKIEGELRDQLEMMNTRLNKMAMNNIARTWVDRKVVRDDLVSQTGEAFAQISEVREVATNTESAFASFQTTVTAQFAAQSASIAIVAAVAADVEGWATASYAIKLDVNGYWSGMQLYNGGPELSGVVFRTDLFKVALPGVGGSDVDVFTVGDVEGVPKVGIRGDMVIDGSVTARMITVIKLDAISADIGDIRAGTLADPLEEIMLIDLNNGRILGYGP